MKKNGFTLVEMLTVIIILVTLGLLATISISGVVKNSSDRLYQIQVESIIDASRTYVLKNSSTLSDHNEITLCDLKRASLIERDLKNPKTEKEFANNLIVKIIKNDSGEYDFIFDAESQMNNYYCDYDISVALNGSSPLYVKLGDSHEELGVTVKMKDTICSKRTGSEVSSSNNCYYSLSLSGNYTSALTNNKYSKTGTYTENYLIEDANFSSTITRTIIVEDKTPPVITVANGASNHTSSFEIRALEGEAVSLSCSAYDIKDEVLPCELVRSNYSYNSPGTYENVYKATDKSGNSTTLVATIIVLAKSKNLLVGLEVSENEWTSNPVTLKVFPLYSTGCSNYSYTFDGGNNWSSTNTLEVTSNSEYKVGISCNTSADFYTYKVDNIDDVNPYFLSNPSINVESETSNIARIEKSGITHYYASGRVVLTNPLGARDDESGIKEYQIFANDILVEDEVLTEVGRYEIKLKALDYALNESEEVIVAYVTISDFTPTCEFLTCTNNCNTLKPIESTVIQYNTKYQFTTDNFMIAPTISYKFSCQYQYYEFEEDIYETTNISNNSIYMLEESNSNTNIVVNSITASLASASSTCASGVCTKVIPYVASISFNGFTDISSSFAKLYLSANALCDRLNNCNNNIISSMPVWRQ